LQVPGKKSRQNEWFFTLSCHLLVKQKYPSEIRGKALNYGNSLQITGSQPLLAKFKKIKAQLVRKGIS
jgi:hypothetical protein